jgi:hypothetical protein
MAEVVYNVAGACFHRDRVQFAEFVRRTGTPAKPFFLYAGDRKSRDAEPIQFVGQVIQEVVWQGLREDGHHGADLATVYFNMTAEHPQFGTLTIAYDASRPGGGATLRAVERGKPFPVIHTTKLHVIAVSSALPGLVLQNQGPPLRFISSPSPQWPPENTIYTLKVKVRFEDRYNRGPVVINASAGSALVGSH